MIFQLLNQGFIGLSASSDLWNTSVLDSRIWYISHIRNKFQHSERHYSTPPMAGRGWPGILFSISTMRNASFLLKVRNVLPKIYLAALQCNKFGLKLPLSTFGGDFTTQNLRNHISGYRCAVLKIVHP